MLDGTRPSNLFCDALANPRSFVRGYANATITNTPAGTALPLPEEQSAAQCALRSTA